MYISSLSSALSPSTSTKPIPFHCADPVSAGDACNHSENRLIGLRNPQLVCRASGELALGAHVLVIASGEIGRQAHWPVNWRLVAYLVWWLNAWLGAFLTT